MRLQDVHVALVDDDDSVRRAVGRLLSVAGMHVSVYASGDELLKDLDRQPPDCVVLDMCMPAMSGLDVQAALTALHYRVPIVFITAHDDPAAEQRGLNAGAITCLHKPFSEQALLAAIAQATEAHAANG